MPILVRNRPKRKQRRTPGSNKFLWKRAIERAVVRRSRVGENQTASTEGVAVRKEGPHVGSSSQQHRSTVGCLGTGAGEGGADPSRRHAGNAGTGNVDDHPCGDAGIVGCGAWAEYEQPAARRSGTDRA